MKLKQISNHNSESYLKYIFDIIKRSILFIIMYLSLFFSSSYSIKTKIVRQRVVIFFIATVMIIHLGFFVQYHHIQDILDFLRNQVPEIPAILNPVVIELDQDVVESEQIVQSNVFSNKNREGVEWVGAIPLSQEQQDSQQTNEIAEAEVVTPAQQQIANNVRENFEQWRSQRSRERSQNQTGRQIRHERPPSPLYDPDAPGTDNNNQGLPSQSNSDSDNPNENEMNNDSNQGNNTLESLASLGNPMISDGGRHSYSGSISFDPNRPMDFAASGIDDFELYQYLINMGWKTLYSWNDYLPKNQLAWGLLRPGEVVMEFSIDESGNVTYYRMLQPNQQPSINRSTEQALEYVGNFGKQPDNVVIKKLVFEFRVYPVQHSVEQTTQGEMHTAHLTFGITLNFDIDQIDEENR